MHMHRLMLPLSKLGFLCLRLFCHDTPQPHSMARLSPSTSEALSPLMSWVLSLRTRLPVPCELENCRLAVVVCSVSGADELYAPTASSPVSSAVVTPAHRTRDSEELYLPLVCQHCISANISFQRPMADKATRDELLFLVRHQAGIKGGNFRHPSRLWSSELCSC